MKRVLRFKLSLLDTQSIINFIVFTMITHYRYYYYYYYYYFYYYCCERHYHFCSSVLIISTLLREGNSLFF